MLACTASHLCLQPVTNPESVAHDQRSAKSCSFHTAKPCVQAVSDNEDEVTKHKVQISTATRQAEKLSKLVTKAQQEIDGAVQDLEGMQQGQQVS